MSRDLGTAADGYEAWSRAGWHTHVPGAGEMHDIGAQGRRRRAQIAAGAGQGGGAVRCTKIF